MIAGLGFVFLFVVLMLFAAFLEQQQILPYKLRHLPAFSRLIEKIGLAVEDGKRVHVSLGRGSLADADSPSALIGLTIAERITQITSVSDHPTIITAGDGSLGVLAQDSLSATYREMGAAQTYNPVLSQVSGLSPFAYAAGVMHKSRETDISVHVLAGHFGSEVALITDAIERAGSIALAGSDHIPAQALLYATAQEPLIGEEVFAGGAYLRAGRMHLASLRTQDTIRWILVIVMLGGSILKLLGVL